MRQLFTRNYVLLLLGIFVFACAFLMLFPVMPVFAMKKIGLAEGNIGLIVGIFSMSALACRPIAGYIADRYGRKILIMAAGILFTAVAFYYSFICTIAMLFLLRVLFGAAWSSLFTGATTVVADVLPREKLGEGMGYFSMLMPLAMVISPAVGLEIFTRTGGFPAVFTSSAALGVLALLFLSMLKLPPVAGSGAKLRPTPGALYEKKVLGIAVMQFIYSFSYSGIVVFIPLFAMNTGIGKSSWFFIFFALSVLVSRLFIVRKTFDRGGPDLLIIAGYLCLAGGAATLALSSASAGFFAGGILIGLGGGMILPTLHAMTMCMVAPGMRGKANATVLTAVDLGMAAGSMSMGYLIQHTSYRTEFAFISLLPVFALAWYIFYIRKRYPADKIN